MRKYPVVTRTHLAGPAATRRKRFDRYAWKQTRPAVDLRVSQTDSSLVSRGHTQKKSSSDIRFPKCYVLTRLARYIHAAM